VGSVLALAPPTAVLGQGGGGVSSGRGGLEHGIRSLGVTATLRCCDGGSQSTLLRSGGGKRWGRVERLNLFRFLRRYHGVHVSRTWPHGRWHRGRGERGSLGRGRAALRDDLGEGNLEGQGAAAALPNTPLASCELLPAPTLVSRGSTSPTRSLAPQPGLSYQSTSPSAM
jgi:hypothetical protein